MIMNDQLINQLAMQNERIANLYSIGPVQRAEVTQFVESIVNECISVVDKIIPPGYTDYPDYRDQIEQAFRRECATEIKQHFGVEE